jgi:hypothetical protein
VLLDNVRLRGQAAVSFPPINLSTTDALLAPGLTVNVEVSSERGAGPRALEVVLPADPEVAASPGPMRTENHFVFEQMPPGTPRQWFQTWRSRA